MTSNIPSLETLHETVWSVLQNATASRKHPFHTPAIANVSSGIPSARTVVLRHADPEERTLTFHTDTRSQKIIDLERDPQLQWLFYDPHAGTQLGITTVATVHKDDDIANQAWADSPLFSRRCYLSRYAPGAPLDAPESGIPVEFESRRPTESETASARPNFAVVRCRALTLHWLLLRATGNLAATIRYGESGDVDARWVAP